MRYPHSFGIGPTHRNTNNNIYIAMVLWLRLLACGLSIKNSPAGLNTRWFFSELTRNIEPPYVNNALRL